MNKFSLIIPIYNPNYIKIQLKSIYNLYLIKIGLEVIFIDDGSEKKYHDFVKKTCLKLSNNNIRLIFYRLGEKKGKNRVSLARNKGVELSHTDNLIFIDQDTILHKYFFKKLCEKYNKNKIILGSSLGYNNQKKSINGKDILKFMSTGKIYKINFSDFRSTATVVTWRIFGASNLFIKKSVFLDIGGFDSNLISWGDEDVEFGYRLYKKGYNILFDENLIVLNLSRKLYVKPYNILQNKHIESLTTNFYQNYRKHNYSFEYKDYILDRFLYFSYNKKLLSSHIFQKNILGHSFYKNKNKSTILFRLDDINTNNFSQIKKILAIFIYYEIPLSLGVEPYNIDESIINYLNYIKNKYPNIIDLVQHGYKHNDYSPKNGLQYEFGKLRSFTKQMYDIKKGENIMKKYFKNFYFKCFIPPFNNIDKNTEIILEKLKFLSFSSGKPYDFYLGNKKILSIPFYMDIIYNYYPLIYKNKIKVISEINYYIKRDGFVGIILHPQYLQNKQQKLLKSIFSLFSKDKYNYLNLSKFYKKYNEI